ncbi:MAG: hypothetical protein LBF08_08265 [Dysgonamonadaceae bacterium]|jgi:hypothetical protein|nr:hypothetical protein [Dysgonamonadaceae bacterium]
MEYLDEESFGEIRGFFVCRSVIANRAAVKQFGAEPFVPTKGSLQDVLLNSSSVPKNKHPQPINHPPSQPLVV